MDWMDQVFLAKYDVRQNTVDLLPPHDTPEFFFREELAQIERDLADHILGARTGRDPAELAGGPHAASGTEETVMEGASS